MPPAEVACPRFHRKKSKDSSPRTAFDDLIAGTVPPINVLIMEDNIVNQKFLEAFMKRHVGSVLQMVKRQCGSGDMDSSI